MDLLNVKTQQVETLPDAQIPQALSSGTHLADTNLDVPLVSPDGAIGSVKGGDLVKAFGEGYRFATPEDTRSTGNAAMNQAAKAVFADHPATALGAGLLAGGTFGLSNVAVDALGAGDALKQSKEANPLAYGAGELVGAVTSPVVGAVAKGAGSALVGAGEAAGLLKGGQVAAGAMGPSQALSVGARIARGAAEQIGEGAVYGLGSGIGEAALGDPNDVAQHLMAGVGQGALLGGAIGAGFETAGILKKPLFDFAESITSKGSDLVQDAARGIAKRSMMDSITTKGMEDLNPIAKDLVNEPGFRNEAFNNGGLKDFAATTKEADNAIGQVATDTAETRRQLNEYLKDLPKDAKSDVQEMLQQNRGDLSEAMTSSFNDYKSIKANYDNSLSLANEPAQIADRLLGDTEDLIKKLKDTSADPAAIERANLLQEIVNAKVPRQILGLTDARSEIMSAGFTAGDEIQLANRLRQYIPVKDTNLGKYSTDARAALIDYRKSIDDYALKNHPIAEYAAQQQTVDRYYAAYKNMENFVMRGKGSNKAVMETPGLLKTIQMPERSEAFNKVLDNLSDFTPALDKVAQGRNNIEMRLDGINDFQKLIRQKAIDFGPQSFTSSDIQELSNILGPTEKLSQGIAKLQNQESLQQALSQSTNPAEKLLMIKKASGQSITPELQNLSASSDNYSKLSDMLDQQKASQKDQTGELLKRLTGGGIGGAIGGALGSAKTGAAVGGVISKAVEGIDPVSTLRLLTNIEQAASKSAKMTNKVIESAVNGLTSDTAQKLATVGTIESKPLEQARKDFKKQTEYLTNFSDPNQTKRILDSKIGTIQQAPQIEKSLKDQMTAQGKYLLQQVPKDPLASNNIFPGNSKWQPSDMDLARFNRQAEAAANPLNVVAKVANGSVTPEEVSTLQSLYPTIYKQLQSRVSSAIIERGDDISYQQKLKLSQLFSVPTDPSLAPQSVANLQSNFGADKPQANDSPGNLDNKKPTKVKINSQDYQTSTQRVTGK